MNFDTFLESTFSPNECDTQTEKLLRHCWNSAIGAAYSLANRETFVISEPSARHKIYSLAQTILTLETKED